MIRSLRSGYRFLADAAPGTFTVVLNARKRRLFKIYHRLMLARMRIYVSVTGFLVSVAVLVVPAKTAKAVEAAACIKLIQENSVKLWYNSCTGPVFFQWISRDCPQKCGADILGPGQKETTDTVGPFEVAACSPPLVVSRNWRGGSYRCSEYGEN